MIKQYLHIYIYKNGETKWSLDKPTLTDVLAMNQGLLIILKVVSLRYVLRLTNQGWTKLNEAELKLDIKQGFHH